MAFDFCKNIQDGRGYTSGIIGFTTGTADALSVIRAYQNDPRQTHEFDSYVGALQNIVDHLPPSSTSGLKGYCSAWRTACNNTAFLNAQITKLNELYYIPSQKNATDLGLRHTVSFGEFYDTAIQHGINGPDSLGEIISRISSKPPSQGGDEIKYLTEFLALRKKVLCNAKDESTRKLWCGTVARVDSYAFILQNTPDYNDSVTILNNDGKKVDLKCRLDLETLFIPTPRNGDDESEQHALSSLAIFGIVFAVIAFLAVCWHLFRKKGKVPKYFGGV